MVETEPMKIQLWMRGHDSSGRVSVYRTITEAECAQVFAEIVQNDGTRPWEQEEEE